MSNYKKFLKKSNTLSEEQGGKMETTETTSISTPDIKISDFVSQDFNYEQWEFIEKKVDRIKVPVNRTIANDFSMLFPYRANRLPESIQEFKDKGGNSLEVKVLAYETTKGDKQSNIIFTLPFQETYEPHFGPKVGITYENILKYAVAEKTLEPEFREKNFVKRTGGTSKDYAELDNRLKFLTNANYQIKTFVKTKIRGKMRVVKYEEVSHLIDGYKKLGDIYKVRLNPDRHQHILAISKGEKPTDYLRIEGTQSRGNALNFYLDTKKGFGKIYPRTVRFILDSVIGLSKEQLYRKSITFFAEILDKAFQKVQGWEWEVDAEKLSISNALKTTLSNIPQTGWTRLITFLKENKTEIEPIRKQDFLKLKIVFKEIHQN